MSLTTTTRRFTAAFTKGSDAGAQLRYRVRRTINRIDNEEVRKARRMVSTLRRNPPEVLYIGDSVAVWVAPTDTDRRRLPAMIQDLLGPTVSMHSIAGGSYHAELINHFVTPLRSVPARPVVVVPLWIRGRTLPWIQHPAFGYRRVMQVMEQLDFGGPTWRMHASLPRPTSEEFEEFYRHEFTTLAGTMAVGDYVRLLKDPKTVADPDARTRLIYAYHQGSRLETGSWQLDAVTALGAQLREVGCPVVAYQTPVSVQTGERYYGPAFGELIRHNFAVLDDALRAGLGNDADILQTGTIFGSGEFIEENIADEHLNERGRRRLAGLIVERIQQVRAEGR